MQKKFLKLFKIFFLLYFFSFFSINKAEAVIDIKISGNQNISIDTIKSYADKNLNYLDVKNIDKYQKTLFETGFFKSVKFKINNNILYINVDENPLINFFYIDGIKSKTLLAKIESVISIKENQIFQPHFIKKDIENLSTFLSSLGYLKNDISFEIIAIENNKINIFYNITLNNKFKINRIFFVGDKKFKSSTLIDTIYSSEHGWWKFLSNSTTPSEELINVDTFRLKKFYRNNGYYDVQITSQSIKLIDNKNANLTFSINAGQKYIIDNSIITDNTNTLTEENIVKLNKILEKLNGEVFNEDLIIKNLEKIKNFLLQEKYNLISTYSTQKINKNNIKLNFSISDLTNKQIVNKITFSGNSITDDFVIRNQIKFSEGDILNIESLNKSIDTLKGTGLFKKVNYETKTLIDNSVDILINVEEQATGELSAGASAGTNGVTFVSGIKEKNFLGKGINLDGNISIGTEKILGKITYTNPDFNNSGKTFNYSLFIENNAFDSSGYENKIIGSSISSNYEIYESIFLNPGLRVDYDSLNANSDSSSLIKRREGDFFTSKIFYNIYKNTLNRSFNPTSGETFGIGQGFSIISDIPYVKNSIFGSYFNEYMDGFVGSIKYRIENITGFGEDIKFSDRLFINGSNLRGFSERGVGPKIDNDYIGGNYSYYTNFSSLFPNGLPEKWNAVSNVFFDVGNLWGVDDNSTEDSNKIRSSVGVGFSWISPLGPISITYAEPLSQASSDDIEKFNFKIGTAF